jgi:rSAM/selenodomain-associated transferase 1
LRTLKESFNNMIKALPQTRIDISSPCSLGDRCILFFVKYPERGKVKNRLAVDLTGVDIAELYRNFVLDLITMLEELCIPFHICYFPENAEKRFIAWLGNHYQYIPQEGKNLGERMQNSFVQAFLQGFHRVITIGSDSPDLPRTFIEEAFSYLKTMDSVIGPARDGGYYLIGFRKETFFKEVFADITWSTDKVFDESRARLKNAGHKTYILPPWHDIDTLADLQELIRRSNNAPFGSSKTMSFLLNSKLPLVTSTHEETTE